MLNLKKMVAVAALLLGAAPAAYAANYQDGKTATCNAANSCTVTFRNPGAGKTLRVTNLGCKVVTNESAPAFVMQFFDGRHTLFVPTYVQDIEHRSFVASASGNLMFFTGGAQMKATALHGATVDSQLVCTLTGITN